MRLVMCHSHRLMVNLTQPVIVCFNNQLPEEKTLRQHCLEVESHLQQYKEVGFFKFICFVQVVSIV